VSEPVEWRPDGTPRSARFDDIYRPANGGLEQARHVFLRGCGLPGQWGGKAQWRILETGFGLGLNFLAAWRAWKDDAQRPGILHFVSVEAYPVAAEDILRGADRNTELESLARELVAQWWSLTPGGHRLSFEGGRVLLTLHIRDVRDMLRSEPFTADSVFLDGFDPRCNPRMWELETIKAAARHCRRGTRLATWSVSGDVRRALAECGFDVHKSDGLAPKRECTQAVFDPRWEPKGLRDGVAIQPADAIVIGAGLAGAAAANSLARRGWDVTVLDAAPTPAAGASALPIGLMAPHVSPDDNLLSRLTREGVRMTLHQARALLCEDEEWQPTDVLHVEHGVQTRVDNAAWISPSALVHAWLAHPAITWRGNTRVGSADSLRSGLVVVAAANASQQLLGAAMGLNSVRGQIMWGSRDESLRLPPTPVNGNGHFIPTPHAWCSGSTYGRGDDDTSVRAEDTAANMARLRELLPSVAAQLESREIRSWAGVRCTSRDRRPLVGEVHPGLWVTTAMGSRGLSFCTLAGELIAARLHDEPLPVDSRLASALDVRRALQPQA
jgi:tRNA 5-methylaminomethyl-2-thiouridine biosynthesis bifunctional protein